MAYEAVLEGELGGFNWQADDGSFAVARIRQEGQPEVIAVGPIGHLPPGAHLRLEGSWSTHPKHGRRFKVRHYLVDDPRTLKGLTLYLASGAVRGLGAELAKRAVAKFGLDTLRILDEEPDKLLEVNGVGRKRLEQILEHWDADKQGRELAVMLRGHGLGAALVHRIQDRYGAKALQVVSSDPYRLAAEIKGVAFRTADAIAQAMGVALDDPRRAEAASRWLLDEAGKDGHCFLPRGELARRAQELGLEDPVIEAALGRLTLAGRVSVKQAADPQLRPVYDSGVERSEERVARLLAARLGRSGGGQVSAALAERRVGLNLNEDQRRAVTTALSERLCVITGGPGTGKTTIVRVALEAAALREERWLLAAPTGRAARRLAESTGRDGKTIHRLLEYSFQSGGFQRDESNPVEADGVLVDEASMVDLALMESLVRALPGDCRLILVGDADQLPSVGAGRVLGDLIESGVVPVVSLHQVYRQAEDSGIVRNAHRVLKGLPPVSSEREPEVVPRQDFFVLRREDSWELRETLLKVVNENLRRKGFDPRSDVQVLTPMHKGPLGSRALNRALQDLLNPQGRELVRGEKVLRVGDRVIQVRNDYDNDIFNGDVGTITGIEAAAVTVEFDGREVALVGEQLDQVELAYAISIHKSQGSEYPAVVVAMHTGHHVMLRRNLLYTAMTRAKDFCCLMVHPMALRRAVRERGGEQRWTGLCERLQKASG